MQFDNLQAISSQSLNQLHMKVYKDPSYTEEIKISQNGKEKPLFFWLAPKKSDLVNLNGEEAKIIPFADIK